MTLVVKPTIWENFYGASPKDMIITFYILTCPEARLEGPFLFNQREAARTTKLTKHKVGHCIEWWFPQVNWVVSGNYIDINSEWTSRVVVTR